MVSFANSLIVLLQTEPDWLKSATDVTAEVHEIQKVSTSMGGMDWALPLGVLALVFLRISPILGSMLQEEHKLSIDRRRQKELAGGKRGANQHSESD